MSALQVLMLEDSPLDADLICDQLEAGGIPATVRRVDARADFLSELGRHPLDLILADFSLPTFDGISALQLARDQRPEIPFLFVSGALGEELAIETLKNGATDYVLKQRLERLVPSVQRALSEAKEKAQRKRAEDSLRFLADASGLLSTSLDFSETLTRVCRIVVPQVADGTVLFLKDESGHLRPVSTHHREARKADLLLQHLPTGVIGDWLAPDSANPAMEGRRTIHRTIPDAPNPPWTDAPAAAELFEVFAGSTMVCSPLIARARTLGAICFLRSRGSRRFDAPDSGVCEEFARRAALAVDASKLHQDVQLADKRKDEFLAMLAHELRNPLAPMVTALEVMKSRFPEDEVLGRTRAMLERQAKHMARLIDDLLDVSRITRGKIALRRQVLESQKALRNALETCRPAIEARDHTLNVHIPDGSLFVDADPARLEQILSNLIHNAAKYTEPGGIIDVSLREERGQVVVTVKDSGIGIPDEMLSRVFDIFVQVSPTLDRSQGGLGLGLTLVKKLVELHGGGVEASSPGENQGSTFSVRFPRAEGVAASRRTTSQEMPRVSPGVLRILIVEDNVDARETLQDLLELWGHSVQVAHDGQAALEKVEDQLFDLALVDVGLPRIDGYAVAQAVRGIEKAQERPRMRLVALTGYGQPEDRKKALESGFDAHRTKPLESQELRRVLAHAAATQAQRMTTKVPGGGGGGGAERPPLQPSHETEAPEGRPGASA